MPKTNLDKGTIYSFKPTSSLHTFPTSLGNNGTIRLQNFQTPNFTNTNTIESNFQHTNNLFRHLTIGPIQYFPEKNFTKPEKQPLTSHPQVTP